MEINSFENLYNVLSNIKVHQIIIYLRKSRNEEKEPIEEVLARHEKLLQEYAIRNFGEKIPEANVFKEIISGETIEERIEIKKVFSRLADNDIKAVLVVEPSRLSRGDLEDCGKLINKLRYNEIFCITPSKTYDLNNKFDNKMFQMELIQGNEYLEYTKTIMNRGKKLSLEEGKFVHSTPPYGYSREKLHKGFKLVPNPKEAPIIQMIFELFVEGNMGTNRLANYLNKHKIKSKSGKQWNAEMVKNILKNETYYGMLVNQKRKLVKKMVDGDKLVKTLTRQKKYELIKGMHEPLITKEVFELAQLKIKNHPSAHVGIDKELRNPLASILYCEICGRSMMRCRATKKERKEKRVHEINKVELAAFIREHKEKANITFREIAETLDMPISNVFSWTSKREDALFFSKKFSDKWFEIKEILNIQDDKYDEIITTYHKPNEPRPDVIICPNPACSNIGCNLEIVENAIIKKLEELLSEYNYFLDNYEQEAKTKKTNNAKKIKQIENKLDKYKLALTKARRDYNEEKFSYEEYLEDKNYYGKLIEELEKELHEVSNKEEEEIIIQYKKAVPILANCIKQYNTITSITDKNELLKSFIEEIGYKKTEKACTKAAMNKKTDEYIFLTIHTKF